MKELHLFGCSFTHRLTLMVDGLFDGKFDYYNHAKDSASNYYILKKFKELSTENSVCVVQWSSLTRPNDENFSVVESSDNPLYDLLEEWYLMIQEVQRVAKVRNIKLIQFVGWSVWKDEELNDHHRNRLKSFDIQWFRSSPQWDSITSNCFQFQQPNEWSSNENEDGLYYWDELTWGGMSEWVRENVELNDRYTLIPEHQRNGGPEIDPHPTPLAMKRFYEEIIIPQIL